MADQEIDDRQVAIVFEPITAAHDLGHLLDRQQLKRMHLAIDRPGREIRQQFEIVESGNGNALHKIVNVTIAALPGISVGLLVDTEIAIVERIFMGAGQFFRLQEVSVELPGFGGCVRTTET